MYTSIDIDFEVYKELTMRRQTPETSYNDVLRDVLELGKAPVTANGGGGHTPKEGIPWKVKGVTFPHGTPFRATYKGEEYLARVENGALVYDGKRFTSPSGAAMEITDSPVNGWTFWTCKLPGNTLWSTISSFR